MLLDSDLPEDVRSFLESVLGSFRPRHPPACDGPQAGAFEEGHEALTKAMRDLLVDAPEPALQ